ncbi:hypothetical protein SPRG_15273 [Saprolegnia parasitica CBS 223.65]|uniref:RNA-dependent RNA polymerase n=1 Tax=Saprolegnia parasitica (strain CBS 223.65) TaxID=695850 RepID=A0A067BRU2_SAPPC|nr:hypothetical protein SPRG_15273 [Saprolegnia parasitica CBS 223.65]KDO19525.1 hypothetical protein SPRG_15273 [Saprolegnia parasitica CBS 223.65]|eukprot:XP_012209752.1 hypothetical protein SPRG_15273 [Saprolegnia parasitica CBS 223.65]
MLTVELIEAQAQAREAARREHDRATAYSNNFARAVSSTTDVFAATVNNVPSDATAADVARFCRQCTNMYGGFLSVSMAPYHPRRRGRSKVFMASRLFHALVLALDGIYWQGEVIRVRDAAAVGRSACTDVMSNLLACQAFYVLVTAASDEPAFAAFDAVTLTTSSTDATTFAIAFDDDYNDDDRYRISFKVTDVVRCRVGWDEDYCVVVRFTLRTPPLVFVGDRTATDEDRIWPIADAAFKWERSDDPSPNGVFGHCRCYHLVLEPGVSPDTVATMLRNFGLADVARDDRLPVYTGVLPSPPTDWAYGHASELQHVSFPLRYALHVLMSQEALVVTSLGDAEYVARMLDYSMASSTDVLGFLYSSLRAPVDGPPDLQAFSNWLSNLPRHRQNVELMLTPTSTTPVNADEMTPATMPEVRRVLVTPLRIVAEPPQVDASNRVLRQYAQHVDRFLRVTFVDEEFGPLHGAKSPRILDRIAAILRHGLVVGGEKYVFLGYSSSQLRVHSCWFYRDPPIGTVGVPTAASIYASIGVLDSIPSGSKRGARLGQAFSTTTPTVRMRSFEHAVGPDMVRNGRIFSDGIGFISPALATTIATSLGLKDVPSAFQIRYGGGKGVVAVYEKCPVDIWGQRTVADMQLRISMLKFVSDHNQIEVCSVPQTLPAYLNRQLITLLLTRGIKSKAILSVAHETLRDTAAPLKTHAKAIQFVQSHAPKATIVKLLEVGVSVQDPFVADWLHMLRRHVYNNVKFRSRIRVFDGVVLMGVLDETNTLPEGCVFFQSSNMSRYAITPPALGTRCVVGRNPSLHPGDLRILTYYADVPALHHLYDVLVFSSRGDRPVTDMMSGGDLDGDLYFCLWDHRLVPAQDVPPMHPPPTSWGIPPPSSAPGIQGIQDHFVRFLEHDNLGMIANMHLAVADASRDRAHDNRALDLAHAHAIAVDFAKAGTAARTPTFEVPAYPDFMERSGLSYKSKTAIGILYRQSRVVVPGYEAHVSDARHWFVQYAHALFTLCQQYGIGTEVELISGYIQKLSRKVGRAERLDPADDAVERIRVAVRFVQEHYARVFWRGLEAKAPSDLVVLQKASAWYYVGNTYDEGTTPYRSFAWLALEPLCVLLDQR